jgi:hypothetical protein
MIIYLCLLVLASITSDLFTCVKGSLPKDEGPDYQKGESYFTKDEPNETCKGTKNCKNVSGHTLRELAM